MTAAPTLASTSPADNAADVARDTDIVLTFSENISAGSSDNAIAASADDSLVTSWTSDGAGVAISGTDVTLTTGVNPLQPVADWRALLKPV